MNFYVPNLELLHVESELHVQKQHLQFVRQQLTKQAELSERKLEKKLADLERESAPSDRMEHEVAMQERQMHEHTHRTFVQEDVPRMLINPFIVSLWSLFETATSDVAERVRKKKELELKLGDINGSYYIERVEKYFNHVLHFPTGFDEVDDNGERVGDRLERIAKIRNAIAHQHGWLKGLEDDLVEKIESGDAVGIKPPLPHRYNDEGTPFILEEKFANRAFKIVSRYLKALMGRYQDL